LTSSAFKALDAMILRYLLVNHPFHTPKANREIPHFNFVLGRFPAISVIEVAKVAGYEKYAKVAVQNCGLDYDVYPRAGPENGVSFVSGRLSVR